MIDWTDIESRFRIAELFLDGFRVPSSADFDRHEANLLTGGLVSTRFDRNSAYFELFALPGGQNWINRSRQLELEITGKYELKIDDFTLPATRWREIIASCVSERIFSNEFLRAWSTMEQLSGRLMELDALNRSAQGQFKREMATGSSTNMKAQKCWYALWLRERDGIEAKSKREAAQEELLDVCLNAHESRLQCPINPDFYNAAWFRRLLRRDGKKLGPKDRRRIDVELTGSLSRLAIAELRSLASDPLIVASVLPPLRRSAFQEIPTAP